MSRAWRVVFFLIAAGVALAVAGCSTAAPRRAAQPGRTTLASPLVILPAQLIGNHLVIEAKGDRAGPHRFLIDTGASVTLVTPALARRQGAQEISPATPRVRVTGADGSVTELTRGLLRRLELGEARFDDVDVLVHDCAALSAHLGVKIDGVLGFPLFRELLLTLDYPGSRVLLQSSLEGPLLPGAAVAFDGARKIPLISVRLGERSLVALIDSGSDAAMSVNPVGLEPRFVHGPTVGATVGTLGGEHTQRIGRLAESLTVGGQVFPQPIVEVTDELSAIGGGLLRNFSVSFDQRRDRVTFFRDGRAPIVMPPRRSAGVSFTKTPAYWRIAGVVPKSPADAEGILPGDLVTKINGESVAKWDLRRYEQLIATAPEIGLTFIHGNAETEKRVRVFELVP